MTDETIPQAFVEAWNQIDDPSEATVGEAWNGPEGHLYRAGVKAERERCAKIAETHNCRCCSVVNGHATDIAAAIRRVKA